MIVISCRLSLVLLISNIERYVNLIVMVTLLSLNLYKWDFTILNFKIVKFSIFKIFIWKNFTRNMTNIIILI